MIYIDKNGKEYDTNQLALLSNKGSSSIVYSIDSSRVLHVCDESEYFLSDNMIEVYKEFSRHQYNCFIHIESEVKNSISERISGYITTKYENNGIPLIYRNKKEIFNILRLLDIDINILSKRGIRLRDLPHIDNFAIEKLLVFIDIGDFKKYNLEEQSLLKLNREHIVNALNFIMKYSFISMELYHALNEYLNIIKEYIDFTKELAPQYCELLNDIDDSIYEYIKKW